MRGCTIDEAQPVMYTLDFHRGCSKTAAADGAERDLRDCIIATNVDNSGHGMQRRSKMCTARVTEWGSGAAKAV